MSLLNRRHAIQLLSASAAGGMLAGCEPSSNVDSANARLAAEWLTPEQLAFSVGQPEANVIVQEFFSMTCPHCASFYINSLPVLQRRFIDTGRMLLVFRDFPLDNMALRAHMLVRAAPPAIGLKLKDVLLRQQSNWMNRSGNLQPLLDLVHLAGLSPTQIDAILSDEAMMDRMIAERQESTTEYGIDATPSFTIGYDKFAGGDINELSDWVSSYSG